MKVNDEQLKQIIVEALGESGLLNNLQGALQGAYSGYQARKNANAKKDELGRLKGYGATPTQGQEDTAEIAKLMNDLYERVGWMALEWKKEGWKSQNEIVKKYIPIIEQLVTKIKETFKGPNYEPNIN